MVLAAAMLASVALAGCGGYGDESAATGTTANEAVRVGLVTDINQLNDHGFNHLAYLGMKRAERELGSQGRVLESNSASDYIPNMSALARQHYDLIVSVGYAQNDAVAKVAAKFPQSRFAIIDVDATSLKGQPKNVLGLVFKEQEVGYLAGYLAALTAKHRPGPDVISSVGGMKEPPVDRFIAGYQAGAQRADPGIKLLNGYSRDWDDQAKCKELALDQIAEGSSVVFQVAGGCGLGALDAANERQVWGVGVDADQSFLGPHILTSAEKKVDVAVFETIESVKNGTFRGGHNETFGLRQRGVGLGKISGRVSSADLRAVQRVSDEIAKGDVTIPSEVGS
jgi:basic membrane protein A